MNGVLSHVCLSRNVNCNRDVFACEISECCSPVVSKLCGAEAFAVRGRCQTSTGMCFCSCSSLLVLHSMISDSNNLDDGSPVLCFSTCKSFKLRFPVDRGFLNLLAWRHTGKLLMFCTLRKV